MEKAPDSLTGSVLSGRYRLGRLIGRGGMGAVYEATQLDLGRRVAVKVLLPHLAEKAEVVARFRREAETAASLGHPNIVQVTDFGRSEEGSVFLVMDYLEGSSLAEACQAGPLPARRVAFIASQVLSALEAAHDAGVVHRDLKPDNIFLTGLSGVDDLVKLLDFGVAKLIEDEGSSLTTTGAVLGTPAYMSPEQARGAEVDGRIDTYALGVVMYQALSGRLPYVGQNYHAMLAAILTSEPVSLSTLCPGLAPGLVAVVERAMSREPTDRFESVAAMGAALRPFVPQSVSTAASTPKAKSDVAMAVTLDSGADLPPGQDTGPGVATGPTSDGNRPNPLPEPTTTADPTPSEGHTGPGAIVVPAGTRPAGRGLPTAALVAGGVVIGIASALTLVLTLRPSDEPAAPPDTGRFTTSPPATMPVPAEPVPSVPQPVGRARPSAQPAKMEHSSPGSRSDAPSPDPERVPGRTDEGSVSRRPRARAPRSRRASPPDERAPESPSPQPSPAAPTCVWGERPNRQPPPPEVLPAPRWGTTPRGTRIQGTGGATDNRYNTRLLRAVVNHHSADLAACYQEHEPRLLSWSMQVDDAGRVVEASPTGTVTGHPGERECVRAAALLFDFGQPPCWSAGEVRFWFDERPLPTAAR